MARPKGFKNKEKKEVESIKPHESAVGTKPIPLTEELLADCIPPTAVVEVVEPAKVQVEDDPRLSNKSLFRPDEAADYFGYGISTIYTWIQHGILKAERYEGTYRISRESILACRFRGRFDPLV